MPLSPPELQLTAARMLKAITNLGHVRTLICIENLSAGGSLSTGAATFPTMGRECLIRIAPNYVSASTNRRAPGADDDSAMDFALYPRSGRARVFPSQDRAVGAAARSRSPSSRTMNEYTMSE
jgi:hypothetical protein